MTKTYIIPETEQLSMLAERPLAGSSDAITSGGDVTGITYGGKSDGSIQPEVKRGYDVWDDDWNK